MQEYREGVSQFAKRISRVTGLLSTLLKSKKIEFRRDYINKYLRQVFLFSFEPSNQATIDISLEKTHTSVNLEAP